MGEKDCVFYLPHELTGGDEICGLTKTFCNCYGKNCIAFKRHTKESKAELAKAIEIRKKQGDLRTVRNIGSTERNIRLNL